jgi:hypothetical protein
VTLVEQEPARATVRVEWKPPTPAQMPPPTAAKPGPIDTP